MKSFITLIAALACCGTLWAHDPAAEIRLNPDRTASNHYAYPIPHDVTPPTLTAAPAGYEPFYIAHYGRHGSRWLTNNRTYKKPVDALTKLHKAGLLNMQGERLLSTLEYVLDASQGRAGDLSDVGAEQLQGIARRMYHNFPEVLGGNAQVDARSTIIIRCILSMQNATMALRACNPSLNIRTDASYHDMFYMGWGYGEDTLANHIRKEMYGLTDSIYRAHVQPGRFIKQLVNDSARASQLINCQQLMRDVFDIGGNMQSHHQFDGLSLYSLFTNDELFELWRMKNIYWYVHWGNAPQNGNRMPYIERALLRNIIATVDTVIATGTRGASLRFGHETCVMPLACLMELDSVNYSCDDLGQLHKHWQDYNIMPKACNIQMVLYRPIGTQGNDPRDILVKVLFNEHEATLPVATDGPYCHWTDLKAHYEQRLTHDTQWAEPAHWVNPVQTW